MSNPYTFVNWGLLGEGKAPPANGLYFNNRKLGDVLVSVWRDPDAIRIEDSPEIGDSTLYYEFEMSLETNFINAGGVSNHNALTINQALIPVVIAEELGLGGEYGHPDKFYSEKGPDDKREYDEAGSQDRMWDMRLKEEYWHLLNPYHIGPYVARWGNFNP